MNKDSYLKANSVLFWLVALIAAGVIFIGVRFIISPLASANGFGVSADGTPTFAYQWTKGTRDIVSGLFIIVFLWMKVSHRVLAAFVFVAALIPLGDILNVYANVGTSNVVALMIHGGTALFMLILASLLLRRS